MKGAGLTYIALATILALPARRASSSTSLGYVGAVVVRVAVAAAVAVHARR